MICPQTFGQGSCLGDTGGPLVAADPARNSSMSFIGVVDWRRGSGCGETYDEEFYVEVSHVVDWLTEQMPDLNTCPAPAEGWNNRRVKTN